MLLGKFVAGHTDGMESTSSTSDLGDPGRPEDQIRLHQAGEALLDADDMAGWAIRFSLLGDVNRLKLLLSLHRAPGITVGDLATAVGMGDNAVSHALSALRLAGVVSSDRDGRFRRWSIIDPEIHGILHSVGASHSALHPDH